MTSALPMTGAGQSMSRASADIVDMSDHAGSARVVGQDHLPHTGCGRHVRLERVLLRLA